jgi:hypothetical protein
MFHPGGQAYPTQPLAATSFEISLAHERSFTERLRRFHLASLLKRTDRMLGGLEELNLMDVPRVPESLRLQIATLVADLPFDYSLLIGVQPSPTDAIDLVFDLQEAILLFMTGASPDGEDLEEAS